MQTSVHNTPLVKVWLNGWAWYVNIITGQLYEFETACCPVPMDHLTESEKRQIHNQLHYYADKRNY